MYNHNYIFKQCHIKQATLTVKINSISMEYTNLNKQIPKLHYTAKSGYYMYKGADFMNSGW
ncbi:hypothetical protein BGX38DRAFT_1186322 [Terfezia claveryi]|nr:hypothetical protein BGX38DRAFT_1186322 [Terfezia claveryi]